MDKIEIYLDFNVLVDLVNRRKRYDMSTIEAMKRSGYIFPYSPFHLEEIAMIMLDNLDADDKLKKAQQHVLALRTVSDCCEYLPGGSLPIQIMIEEPITSLNNRVLKDLWKTTECIEIEEFIDSQRSQKHFDDYLAKISLDPTTPIRSRNTIRAELGIEPNGLSHIDPSRILFDPRVQQLIEWKAPNYGLSTETFPRGAALRRNYDLARNAVDCLMRVLNEAGFYADKSGKHRSYMFDVGHTIYATRAECYVVGDARLLKRAAAIFAFLEGETRVVSPNEFFCCAEPIAENKYSRKKSDANNYE
ncbi:MAG: hypothetical protein U1F77_17775 [Kiritimatiellia bacterium]